MYKLFGVKAVWCKNCLVQKLFGVKGVLGGRLP